MVHVYALNIASLPDPLDAPEMLDGIWPERREKALRQRESLKRKQSAGASLLLRYVLKQCGLDNTVLRYGYNGKPSVEGICFSLSHSGVTVEVRAPVQQQDVSQNAEAALGQLDNEQAP